MSSRAVRRRTQGAQNTLFSLGLYCSHKYSSPLSEGPKIIEEIMVYYCRLTKLVWISTTDHHVQSALLEKNVRMSLWSDGRRRFIVAARSQSPNDAHEFAVCISSTQLWSYSSSIRWCAYFQAGVSKVLFTKEAVNREKKPEYVLSAKEDSTSPSDSSQTEGKKTADISVCY